MKSGFLKLSKNGRSESLAVKTTYLTHYVSYLNLEGEVSSYKISGFIGNLRSNWKWAWQAQFLSYWPITLENWISFRDVQMVLVSFFEIPYGDRLTKNVQKLRVQVIPRSTCNVMSFASSKVLLQTYLRIQTAIINKVYE